MTERPQDDDVVHRRERALVDASEVSWAVRALQRAQVELDSVLAQRLGLRALDYTAMTYLMEAPGPLGPVELAGRLGISSGSGTELVDRLERAGHVHRHRADDDRRRILLELDHGSVGRIVAELGPLFADLETAAAGFTDADRAVITRYLGMVAERTRSFAQRLATSQRLTTSQRPTTAPRRTTPRHRTTD